MELRQVSIYYDSLRALADINLQINPSEVHAIVGEHGAGKTSLCLVISGFLKPHSGAVLIDGQAASSWTPSRARDVGIELVAEDNPLVDNLTVADNLFLDNRGVAAHPFVNRQKQLELARALFRAHRIDLDPGLSCRKLRLSDRVLVDILKHLIKRPRVLILDEALQKLTTPMMGEIIRLLEESRNRGMSVIFVTHRIDDIYHFANKVSIIKNGEILITDSVKNIDKINLIKLAYTQISSKDQIDDANQEFYGLLKYNEAVLKKLAVNLIVVDRMKNIKLVNEYARDFFEIQESSYLNTPLRQLFEPRNREAFEVIQGGLSNPEGGLFYNIPLHRNGVESIANIRIHPINDESFLIGYYLIIEDITERERLREQMLLSEKLASIGLLSAGVAHEINNPLEIVCNHIRYLQFTCRDPALLDTVGKMEDEINSITQIVSNLVAFSDRNRKKLELLELNGLIASILALLKYNAEHRNIAISFRTQADPVYLHINRTELKQVILNLMKNSFEAMNGGGSLTILTNSTTDGGPPMAEIVVRDTGGGIRGGNINDIFLPFFSTKKDQDGNLGLGLSVSYGIIKKYNGTITVRNTEEAGCEVVVRLPLSRVETQTP